MQSEHYDVVIMGAGFAGICQARHLLLKVPGIKVALVDPRPAQRRDKDMKIGESTVEIAAVFMGKELGLHDYLIEQHAPKLGLSFHWPKWADRTETIEDYFHVWNNGQPYLPSFQINRAKFERDVLAMTVELGAVYIQGHVLDVDLTPGDAINTVTAKTDGGELTLHAKHVIDAAGRRFLIGKKTDNLITDPEALYGHDNGSSWVRVRGVDRTLFHSGYEPEGQSSVSRYYATNHFFGEGHWLWMIPTDREEMELSIGVVYHKDVIPTERLDKREKFLAFLQANHRILYDLVASGELVDFHSWPRVAHRSKQMFSPDNWYVIGDAAYILDAFYSFGSSTIALAVESVTEIIRAKLAAEPDAEAKRSVYNEFNLAYAKGANIVYHQHARQLGHAGVMSWRIYFEYLWWFGLHVPMSLGKWHLDPAFAAHFARFIQDFVDDFFPAVYSQLSELAERGCDLGILDCYRADQILPHPSHHRHDSYLEKLKLEPGRVNVYVGLSRTFRAIATWYRHLLWRGYGARGLLNPKNLVRLGRLHYLAAHAAAGGAAFRLKTLGRPANSHVQAAREEFKSYVHQPKLVPWAGLPASKPPASTTAR